MQACSRLDDTSEPVVAPEPAATITVVCGDAAQRTF